MKHQKDSGKIANQPCCCERIWHACPKSGNGPSAKLRGATSNSINNMETPKQYYVMLDGEQTLVDENELIRRGNELKAAGSNLEYCPADGQQWMWFNDRNRIGQQATSQGGESPDSFVRRIRGQTCYGFLRLVIAVFAGLALLGVLVGLVISLGNASNSGGGIVLLSLLLSAVGVVLVIAAWQASILLIDIGDTLIEQNRIKKPDKK